LYVVDTSVWIDYPREGESEAVQHFADVLDLGFPFGVTGVIYGEVLQGAATLADFEQLKEYMGTQRFYHPQDPVFGYEEAARLYYRCRRVGVAVRSTIDCVIAHVAIEHDLSLLHDDRDFDDMSRVVTELKLA
jgi:predicted nucleic acid-binding protein